jgi:hypothetical protein
MKQNETGFYQRMLMDASSFGLEPVILGQIGFQGCRAWGGHFGPRVFAPNISAARVLRLFSIVRRTPQSGLPGRLRGGVPSWHASTNNRTILEPEHRMFGLKPSMDAQLTAPIASPRIAGLGQEFPTILVFKGDD